MLVARDDVTTIECIKENEAKRRLMKIYNCFIGTEENKNKKKERESNHQTIHKAKHEVRNEKRIKPVLDLALFLTSPFF